MNQIQKYYFLGLAAIVIALTAGFGLNHFLKKNQIEIHSNRKSAEAKTPDNNNIKQQEQTPPANEVTEVVPKETVQSLIASGKALHIPILMYHHVGVAPENADATHKGLTVSPEEFTAQVQWLKNNGYTAISFEDLYKHLTKQSLAWPSKPVIFTFDDGYADVFQNAIPILDKYGYKGTFAIITSFPGQTQGDNVYATREDIMAASKNREEIVCHSRNHFDAFSPKFDDAYMLQNFSGCQQDIHAFIGTSLPYLVYPYGHFTDVEVEQAKKAGFVMAFTTRESSYLNTEDLMHVPRVRVNPNESIEKFAEKLKE